MLLLSFIVHPFSFASRQVHFGDTTNFQPQPLCLYCHFPISKKKPLSCEEIQMRPHPALLSSAIIVTAFAQNNGATRALETPSTPTNAVVDITVTQTIEVADMPTGSTSLIYDTSPVKPNTGTPLAMPTSVFITAPSNSTQPTIATAPAGNGIASKTGVAAPSATTKSLGIALDVRISPMWQGLLGVAIVAVVLC